MAKGLTPRQEAILRFVAEYLQDNGYPPSIREIGQKFKIGSLRGVTVHLDALEKKGYIDRANTPRSIRIKHPDFQASTPNVVMLPLLGQIAAGSPILAQEYVEDMVPVPTGMVKNNSDAYLLRVRGDSMSGEGINSQDLVVVKPQQAANQGDLVAVLIGEEATVKRIHFNGGQVRLMPSNPAYEPIVIDREDARILGRVVGLMRDYDGKAF
ncbi:MAG: transcriptional repressor LexA [Fimbriimonadaceae bacterium]|nr:transcriptional repressor LexA [Fimbriimonadaceae bacterium]